jgi:hypothetical protein
MKTKDLPRDSKGRIMSYVDSNQIIELFNQGLKTKEIAIKFNCTPHLICDILRRNNIRHLKRVDYLSESKVLDLRLKGKQSLREIGAELRTSALNIREILVKNGLQINRSYCSKPTSYEKKISNLCIENGLPFSYTGDGTFLIGKKKPDFVNKEKKLAIEVYDDYFKIKKYGSCENYEKTRREYFKDYGWDIVFIRREDITNKNWKQICHDKINSQLCVN